LLLLLVLLATAAAGTFWWWESRREVYTDNAYVAGNITPIASYVTGQVVALFVDDNMIVQPGDPIAQIDPVPFQFEVDEALAEYQQARRAARAANFTALYTTDDRKSLLEGARAKRDEAGQAVKAAEEAVQTQQELLEKDKQLLASLKDELPGLTALRNNARFYFDRFSSLVRSGDVPGQQGDDREAAYRDAEARLNSLNSKIVAAQRQVRASESQLQETKIRYQQSREVLSNSVAVVGQAQASQSFQPEAAKDTAEAQLHTEALAEARLRLLKRKLSNTLIRAPQAGVISRRTIQLGQTIEANKPFLSITPLDADNVWIVANLREEMMARVRVGQPASISVDGIPERIFQGWVESVAGGTGAVFSLFPPDNATGNFVRVVQRLPIRIRFSDDEYEKRIRPGMSTRVTIDTTRFARASNQEW
jgi:membrane fusion protein (multidrug efflux system)